MIQISEHAGSVYYERIYRGVAYAARHHAGRWEVHSRRLALGGIRHNIGSWRFFDSAAELARQVKAFRGLDKLIGDQPSAGAA